MRLRVLLWSGLVIGFLGHDADEDGTVLVVNKTTDKGVANIVHIHATDITAGKSITDL